MGGKTQQAAKGPDNNKRLAEYEREDARLIAFLADNGVTDLGDLSPGGAMIIRCKSLQECKAELEEQYKTREGTIGQIEAERDRGREGVSALVAAMVGAGIEVADGADPFPIAIAHFEAAEEASGDATPGELAAIGRADKAEARVAELEGLLEAAGAAAKVAADAQPPALPRDPVECGPDGPELSAADINLLIVEGVDFELVFSDGANEIVEFPPVALRGGDLGRHGQRYTVTPTISIAGPRGADEAAIEIAGAALLANGEQIGFSAFDRPLVVEPGEQRAFNQAFLFG